MISVSTKHIFSFLLTFVISNALLNFINRPIFIDWLSSYIFNHVKSNHYFKRDNFKNSDEIPLIPTASVSVRVIFRLW